MKVLNFLRKSCKQFSIEFYMMIDFANLLSGAFLTVFFTITTLQIFNQEMCRSLIGIHLPF